MNWTVTSLAARVNGTVEGAGDAEVCALSALAEACAGDVSFLANPRYEHLMAQTAATAVVVSRAWNGARSCQALIRVDNPDKAFADLTALFAPQPVVRMPGVHATALIASSAKLGRDVHVGAYTVIEDGACIGDRSVIETQCFVGRNVMLGADSHLYPQVSLREECRIGERFIAHCGAVVGSDGYGYNVEFRDGRPVVVKIPQVGIVEIGNDVEIGANTAVDRARFGRTRIGNHVKIDNLVQIAHNVQIGDCTGICGQVGIAGSAQIGSGVMIWSQAGIAGHLTVGDRAQIGPQSGISKDVVPGEFMLGSPAVPKKEFVVGMATPRAVAKLKTRVAELEARLAALEKQSA
ncbi:MAG: UDP-3-O-(3-hydroxymyristoyl)glucosamine N-acyltransferase [Kiritimatiellia bacterium]